MSQNTSQSLDQNTVHYLNHYLEKTLGVSQIVAAQAATSQILNQFTGIMPESDLGFFFEDYDQYSDSEKELTRKIIQAMKLELNQYLISDLNKKNDFKNRIQIYFCHKPTQINETYSPRALLLNPELKKKTWDFIQNQMTHF